MELLTPFIDIVLHLDVHLAALTAQYGTWIYAILFLIIFCETGLVVFPFLPGDSLLFVAGALAAIGEGGKVQMALDTTFFARRFGMVTDRFGVSWMVIVPLVDIG